MRYALIENDKVKDIFIEPKGVSITECFHPSIVDLYIPCPENIIEGDYYDPKTKTFSEKENKKLPNESIWITAINDKNQELSTYYKNLTFIINDITLQRHNLQLYKSAIEEANNTEETEIELDGKIILVEDFLNMITAFEAYIDQINKEEVDHSSNIIMINNANEILLYDFTSKVPNTAEI